MAVSVVATWGEDFNSGHLNPQVYDFTGQFTIADDDRLVFFFSCDGGAEEYTTASLDNGVTASSVTQRGTPVTLSTTGAATFSGEPTGTVEGDRLIALLHQDFDGEDTLTAATGWTKIGGVDINDGSDYPAVAAFYIDRGASAPSLAFGSDGSSGVSGVLYAVHGHDVAVAPKFATSVDTGSPATHTPPTVHVAAANAGGFVLIANSDGNATWTTPAAMVEDYEDVPDSFSSAVFASDTALSAGDWSPGAFTPSSTSNRCSMITVVVEPDTGVTQITTGVDNSDGSRNRPTVWISDPLLAATAPTEVSFSGTGVAEQNCLQVAQVRGVSTSSIDADVWENVRTVYNGGTGSDTTVSINGSDTVTDDGSMAFAHVGINSDATAPGTDPTGWTGFNPRDNSNISGYAYYRAFDSGGDHDVTITWSTSRQYAAHSFVLRPAVGPQQRTLGLISSASALYTPALTQPTPQSTVGDMLVMRNNADTTTLPTTGTPLDSTYDTEVKKVGNSITYSEGVFTANEDAMLVLALYSEQFGTSDTASNQRHNWGSWFRINTTDSPYYGWDTGYIRKAGGSQEEITSGIALLALDSGDEVRVRHERAESSTGTTARVADRSGVAFLRLDPDNEHARYTGTATTTSTTDNVDQTIDLSTTEEEDGAVFSRTGDVVTITTSDPVLVAYSQRSIDNTTASRSEYQGFVEFDGAAIPMSWDQTYIRGFSTDDWGGMSSGMILYPDGTGQDLTVEVRSRESGGDDFAACLQLYKLPADAKTILVEATSGEMNASATDFAWDTNPEIDTDVFTHTAGTSVIEVDEADDYLALASLATNTAHGATRAVPAISFRVNNVENEAFGASTYSRNSGTAEYAAASTAGILTDLSATDEVELYTDRLGTNTGTIPVDTGGMALLQLSSILPAASQAVTLGFISSAEVLYTPTMAQPAQQRTLGFITAGGVLYTPAVSLGAHERTIGHIPSGALLYAPAASAGNARTLGFISSGSTLAAPTATRTELITTPFISSGSSLSTPTLTRSEIAEVPFIASGELLFTPSLLREDPQPATLGHISSTEVLYTPSVLQDQRIGNQTIESTAVLFPPFAINTIVPPTLPVIQDRTTVFAPAVTNTFVPPSAPTPRRTAASVTAAHKEWMSGRRRR